MPQTQPKPIMEFQLMTGTHDDWTIADCMWYFEQLNWTFHVNGDAQTVTVDNSDWCIV